MKFDIRHHFSLPRRFPAGANQLSKISGRESRNLGKVWKEGFSGDKGRPLEPLIYHCRLSRSLALELAL